MVSSLHRPVSNILNVPCSSASACVSYSVIPPLPHVQNLSSDISRAHFPTPASAFVYPPSLCVFPPPVLSLLSCFDLSAIPLDLLLPGRYEVSSLCISRACPHEWLQADKQDGWSQTERILLAVRLHLRKGQRMLPPGIQTILMFSGSSSSWTPHCPQITVGQHPKHD